MAPVVETPDATELMLPEEIIVDDLSRVPDANFEELERIATSIENENKRIRLHLYHSVARMFDTALRGVRHRFHQRAA